MTLNNASNHPDRNVQLPKSRPSRQLPTTATRNAVSAPSTSDRTTGRIAPSNHSEQGIDQKFSGDCYDRSNAQDSGAPHSRSRRTGTPAYATAARVQQVSAELNERDMAIVQTLGMVTVATSQQLERLHFTDLAERSRARQRSGILRRLCDNGVLARLPRRVGGMRAGSSGYVFSLDRVGQRLLNRKRVRRPPTPSWPYLRHALSVTELYVAASEAESDGRLDVLQFTAEPQCWQMIEGDVPLRPDGIISVKPHVGDWTDHWALEVDLATERPVRLRKKLLTYWEAFQTGATLKGTTVFPKVLLTVPDEQRLDECLRVLERLPHEAAQLVVVVLHHQATELLTSGGPS